MHFPKRRVSIYLLQAWFLCICLGTTFLETNGIFIHSDAEALGSCTVNSLCTLFICGWGSLKRSAAHIASNKHPASQMLFWNGPKFIWISFLVWKLGWKFHRNNFFFFFFGEISECCGLSKVINKLEKWKAKLAHTHLVLFC